MGAEGRITANPQWFNATSSVDMIPVPPDGEASDAALYYVGLTKLTQGPLADRRFGEVVLPWQERIVRWLPHVDEIDIKCGKGSGKSFMVSAIALGMVMQWVSEGSHRRGLVAIMAANVESAKIVFTHIHEAILADSHLEKEFKSNVQSRSLTHIRSGIVIQIIPPMLKRAVGLRPVLLIVDELHEAAKASEFQTALLQLTQGGKNWDDFKRITITTAPPERAEGYYIDWLAMARAVRDGRIDNPRLLPVLFEFPVLQRPDLDPDDEAYWYFGMPSLIMEPGGMGTMDAKAMRDELQDALKKLDIAGTETYQNLLSQRLGIEAEERQGSGLTYLADYWETGRADKLPDAGYQLFVALDPSAGLDDPFAMVELRKIGGLFFFHSRQWLTQDGYDKSANVLKRLYDEAIEAGELHLVESSDDIEKEVHAACADLVAAHRDYPLFGGDAAGMAGMAERFRERFGDYMAVPQGWQLMASFEAAVALVHAGRLRHIGQPLLTANVRNLRIMNNRLVKNDGNAKGVGRDKIDAAMAMLSTIHMAETQPLVSVDAMIG